MDVRVREPDIHEHAAGAELLRSSLGFTPRDAVPAWFMHATAEAGGLTLGAFASDGQVVGWSFAVLAQRHGSRELLSSGLAVAASHRSAGVGRTLKEAQRTLALERGIVRIRWTADPLAAPALRLYLSQLGARVTGYRAALYDGIRDGGGVPQDDVDVCWDLDGRRGPAPAATERIEVDLPYRREGLAPGEHLEWRMRVRERLTSALGLGYVGIGVERSVDEERAWMVLERRSA